MSADSLRATRVLVSSVLGAEEVDLPLGDVTWIQGPNGSGKSSVLEGILRTITTGAALAEVARIDPSTGEREQPRTMLMLEGTLDGRPRRFLLERRGDKQQVREQVAGAWKAMPRPGELVSALVDGVGANPVRFLQAKPEERTKMLLAALPVILDREKVAQIVAPTGVQVPAGGEAHALTELEMVRGHVYAARTGANRDAQANQNAADRCREAAGSPPQEDASAAAEEAERIAREMRGEVEAYASTSAGIEQAAIQGAQAEAKRLLEAGHAQFSADCAELRRQAERAIEEKRAELERFVTETNEVAARRIERAREAMETARKAVEEQTARITAEAAAARKERDQVLADDRAELEMVTREAARLREVADQAQRAAGLHDQVKEFEAKAEALRETSARMSAALEQLDEYRRSLASDLPAGLELRDGQLMVDGGVPFDQANTATRIRVAVEVSCLRSAGCPWRFVVVDGVEAFDSEHRAALAAELRRQGVQAVLARVDDGPFRGEVA